MHQKTKKGSRLLILIIGLVVILGGILIFILVRQGVIGGKKSSAILTQQELAELPLEEAAPKTVSCFLALYHDCDSKAAEYANGMDGLTFPAIQSAIAKSMKYKVGEVRTVQNDDGTKYVLVNATIETAGFKAAYEEAVKDLPPDADNEAILTAVQKKLEKSPKSARETFNVSIVVLDYVTSRKILMTSELSDALTGGLVTYLSNQTAGGGSHE